MNSPTLRTAPTADELAAIKCPLDRAAFITAFGRTCGTLPKGLAALRRDLLVEARAASHSAGVIAKRVGLSRPRIFQITRAAGQE